MVWDTRGSLIKIHFKEFCLFLVLVFAYQNPFKVESIVDCVLNIQQATENIVERAESNIEALDAQSAQDCQRAVYQTATDVGQRTGYAVSQGAAIALGGPSILATIPILAGQNQASLTNQQTASFASDIGTKFSNTIVEEVEIASFIDDAFSVSGLDDEGDAWTDFINSEEISLNSFADAMIAAASIGDLNVIDPNTCTDVANATEIGTQTATEAAGANTDTADDGILADLGQILVDFVSTILDAVLSLIEGILNDILGTFESFLNGNTEAFSQIGSRIGDRLDTFVQNLLDAGTNFVGEGLESIGENIGDNLYDDIESALNGIGSTTTGNSNTNGSGTNPVGDSGGTDPGDDDLDGGISVDSEAGFSNTDRLARNRAVERINNNLEDVVSPRLTDEQKANAQLYINIRNCSAARAGSGRLISDTSKGQPLNFPTLLRDTINQRIEVAILCSGDTFLGAPYDSLNI